MKLDGKLDEIIEMIIDGQTFRQMAKHYDVSLGTIHYYLSKDENAQRAKAALKISAAQYADKAEEVLINAPSDKDELMRARELAHHYRWKAAKRSPFDYGDKLDMTSGGESINSNVTEDKFNQLLQAAREGIKAD